MQDSLKGVENTGRQTSWEADEKLWFKLWEWRQKAVEIYLACALMRLGRLGISYEGEVDDISQFPNGMLV